MAQNEAKFKVNQFTGGLVTDANPLADAGPISIDEDNCVIMTHGGRRRRRGAALEDSYLSHGTSVTNSQKEDWAFATFEWKAVAGVPGLEFVVYQQGDKLWFYDKSNTSVSVGLKSFSVSLSTYKIAGATTAELRNTRVSVATGKGVIFVCGSTIEPFYVEYDPDTDSITETQITIEIRDFEEQDPSIGPQEEIRHPTTAQHLYDLLNQGWYQKGAYTRDGSSTNRSTDQAMLTKYQGHVEHNPNGYLPRKNTPWHVGKYVVAEDNALKSHNFMSPQQIRSAPSGDTLAPFGHYILEAFNKDRKAVVQAENAGDPILLTAYANLNNLDTETEDERPVSVAFYAGRAWYALKNTVYFSQLLDEKSLEKSGKCYQEGDPTNEGESDIVATDGGVVSIQNMGRVTAMAVMSNALIVFADNGVWSISGAGGTTFTAVDYTVNKLSNISVRSPQSIVEAEGLLFFWSEESIHVIKPGEVRDYPQLQDLAENRIITYYEDIPQASKRNATGVYDPASKTIYWMYKASNDSAGLDVNRFAYDRFLNFSLKFSAFYPWSISATDTHQIVGGTVASGVLAAYTEDYVTTSTGITVTTSDGDPVFVYDISFTELESNLKVLVLKDNAATFGQFDSLDFLDWNENDDGTNYTSFIETFYHIQDDTMAFMQAPYVYTYFKRTEESPIVSTIAAPSVTDISTGGLTWVGEFQSAYTDTTPNNIGSVNTESAVIVAEDGTTLYPLEADSTQVNLVNTATGTIAGSLTNSAFNSDLGLSAGTYNSPTPIALNGTPYLIVKVERSTGVSAFTIFIYYKVEDSTTFTYLGHVFQSNADALTQSQSGFTVKAVGFLNGTQTASPDTTELKAQYPILLSLYEETHGGIAILPSVNDVATNTTIQMPNTADPWYDSQLLFGTDVDFDVQTLRVDATKPTDDSNRGFFLPNSSISSSYLKMFYLADIDEHIAATASPSSSYITTNDSTYPNGFISSVDISGSNFSPSASSTIVGRHTTGFENYPYSNMSTNFDGSAGSSVDNYLGHPSCYPVDPSDITGPWFMFWPKHYKGSSDRSKMGLKITMWNPVTRVVTEIDYAQGEAWEQGVDIDNSYVQEDAGIYWERSTGDIYAVVKVTATGLDGKVYTKLTNFVPQIPDNFSTDPSLIGTTTSTVVESSCLLNTRWDWANASASGKVSSDIQVYRGGRKQFHSDPSNPDPVGLPVYVSKTKTRGRGRALQLRFRSEEGKDFELYGWAVWAMKNTRF